MKREDARALARTLMDAAPGNGSPKRLLGVLVGAQ